MSTELEARIEYVRDVACRKASRTGIARGVASVVAAWIVLGTLDALVRPTDPGLRWMLSIAAWGSMAGAYWWITQWRLRVQSIGPVYVARRIEQTFPQLRNRLACAYEFSRARDDAGLSQGSVELRRATIVEATTLAAELDLSQAIDARPLRPSWWASALVGAVAGLLVLLMPHSSTLAARRLAMPWRDLPWPRTNQLAWVEFPQRVAAGAEVTLVLLDEHGVPPEHVELWYRSDDQETDRVERATMRRRDDRFVYRFEQLSRRLLVRAEGGDDKSLPWQAIDVEEPPRLEQLDVQLLPPEYTGRKAEAAGQPLRALAGTRVALNGRADRALSAARIRSVDGDAATIASARIGEDSRRFAFAREGVAAWELRQSGTFVLELTDDSQLRGEAQRFVVQVLPDDPPTITWESPEQDGAVTPTADVPVRGLVKDDLAVRRVSLRYRVHETTGPRRGRLGEGMQTFDEVLLYEGPPKLEPAADTMGDMAGDSRSIDHAWSLRSVEMLEAGSHLEVWLAAEDYKGQVVEAAARKLQLVSPAEYDDRLGQREASLLHLLNEALRVEREVHQHVATLATLLREAGRLDARHLDQLQAAELQQRHVVRLLGTGRDGARGVVDALRADVRRNHVQNAALVARLETMAREVHEIDERHAARVSPALVAVRKSAPAAVSSDRWPNVDEGMKSLDEAATHAETVCQRLERLLGELSPWDDLRRTMREFARLVRDQEELQRQTAALLQDTDSSSQRSAVRTAERLRLAERQFELERRLAKVTARLEQLRATVKQDGLAGALAAAIAAAQDSPAGARMREAGEQLSVDRLGQALRLEGEAIADLKRITDLLSGRSGERAASPSLPRVEQEILRLLARQQQIRQEITRFATDTPREPDDSEAIRAKRRGELSGEEKTLAATTRQLSVDSRNDAEGVAFVLEGTARHTERLAKELESRKEWSAPLAMLDAIVRRLELLRDSLRSEDEGANATDPPRDDNPQEVPASKAPPRIRGLSDLKLLQSMQVELQRRTGELEGTRRELGSLTPELAAELRDLANEQGKLADLVGRILESTADDATP